MEKPYEFHPPKREAAFVIKVRQMAFRLLDELLGELIEENRRRYRSVNPMLTKDFAAEVRRQTVQDVGKIIADTLDLPANKRILKNVSRRKNGEKELENISKQVVEDVMRQLAELEEEQSRIALCSTKTIHQQPSSPAQWPSLDQ